mmetsp:Transcript_16734/g.25616  ORF Transcript_16734/g.25616 Transcript_16734/m.25616 type:complete len:356 (-) Transcript_16734:776-1843(-)|eukprot:CAMPEP_0118691806 /NCGR_PEP_ID=MMETSP0800-20121206/10898_1 /TAXON_ID=210618 ORGANISM="Striatella unipunctata, Strain CCMP2910" /NCGR_SAMPLE_ID=MMETSP0800 /ASSEMBLY_ACC=CAM_ASM_000638 /LENGTH=355 /DNA_ID=CAMNT_0006589653 /DNA_START=570 /DNA_END=1637 /DNA_ORIENTATION=-
MAEEACFTQKYKDVKEEDIWADEKVEKVVKLWKLTDAEKEQLLKMKEKISDIKHWRNRPDEVVRFVRARSGKPKAAEDWFRKSTKWRGNHKPCPDTIFDTYKPSEKMLARHFATVLDGLDKEGDPIQFSRKGILDPAEILRCFGKEEIVTHSYWLREVFTRGEWQKEYEKRTGHPVGQFLIIEDFKGLTRKSFSPKTQSVLKEFTKHGQQNYPEMVKKVIIVRAPPIIRVIWNIAKHFFKPNVVKKMVFVGPKDYKKVLSEYVDLKVLPKCLFDEGEGKPWPGMPHQIDNDDHTLELTGLEENESCEELNEITVMTPEVPDDDDDDDDEGVPTTPKAESAPETNEVVKAPEVATV